MRNTSSQQKEIKVNKQSICIKNMTSKKNRAKTIDYLREVNHLPPLSKKEKKNLGF